MSGSLLKYTTQNPLLRRLAACTAAGFALSGIYLLIAPSWYSSSLTVIPTKQSRSLGGASEMLGLDPASLGMGNNDVDRIAATFESNLVTDAVIRKLKLESHYGETKIERLRKTLWDHCSIRVVTRGALVTVQCEDQDPAVAMQLADAIGENGLTAFRRVNGSMEGEEVSFLERRIEEARHETDDAARRLRAFEEEHSIVDLDSQSKAVVSALASLQGQRISKELELRYLKKFSSRDEASAVQLRDQISVMDQEAGELSSAVDEAPAPAEPKLPARAGRAQGAKARDLFPPSALVPKLKYEYSELARERRVHEAGLMAVQQRLELARADMVRQGSAFQVLDPSVLAMMPSRPKRSTTLALGALFGLLCGAAWLFGPAYLRSLRGEGRAGS